MGTEETVDLCDLPSAWVVQLMTCLSSRDLQRLLRASTACRNLVLKHAHSTTLGFTLLEKQSSLAVQLGSLQLTSQHSNNITLNLHHGDKQQLPGVVQKETPARDLFTQMAFTLLEVAHSMRLTTAVTNLHLKDARLESPLPLAISEACPNLISLRLSGAWLDWGMATTTSFKGCFPKLQALTLEEEQWVGDGTQWRDLLQQQVGQLTSLQSLSLAGVCQRWSAFGAMGRAAPASQLTHLAVNVRCNADPRHMSWLQPARAAQLVSLQHLVIDGSIVGDTELQVLLSLPSLSNLEVLDFSLQRCFTDQPVRWQQLTMGTIRVEQLAKLPLGNSKLQLTVTAKPRPSWHLTLGLLGTDIAIIDQALSNMSECKGLDWVERVGVRLGKDWAHADAQLKEQLLGKMLQVATGARIIVLEHVQLSQCNVQAICSFLRRSPRCCSVGLLGTCTWTWLACAIVMDSMAAASSLCIVSDSKTGITRLCCMAGRPMFLVVESPLLKAEGDGFLKDVCAAMRLCGHQHVTVSVSQQYFF